MNFRRPIAQYFSAYFPVLLWTGFIFLLSNQPTLPGPELWVYDFIFKKMAHMFVYFVLFFLFFRALHIHSDQKIRLSFTALFLTFLYAMTDEFHQTFVPGRTGTLRDLGFDLIGMSIAWLKLHNYL